ncbi:ABC transporter permease [Paenibacillus medicaginis]|uniref:ABC transporter permease n=1 Tax=Paenibacillus medicaginis TaxID=1470560 RepID=A0ABV5BZY6_9BACL
MHYAKLYMEFIRIRIMGVAENRKAFIIGFIAQFASYFADFFLIWIVITQFKTINGWGAAEVLLLYGLNLCSYAIAGFFFYTPTANLSTMVKDGSFDDVLLKPLNSFGFLICRDFNAGYISHFILALGVILFSLHSLQVPLDIVNGLFLVVTLIGGALIQGAALILTSVPSFWVVENKSLTDILFFQAKSFIKYPISIFAMPVQIIFTYILPYAFINFYPAQYFLGKNELSIFHPAFQFFTPIVGIVLFLIAYLFWNIGINYYKSTGS